MNILDMTTIRLAAGLILVILANIALGSTSAIIEGDWDKVKFRNGCIKGGVVAVALIAVYFAGYLNPNLMVVDIDGQTVNLMTAVSLVMLAAFTAYAVDVIKKLKDMLTATTPGSNNPNPPSETVELEESLDVDERVKIKEEDEHDTADPSN